MDILDADENPLVSSRGKRMSRDIVQFVPFLEFQDKKPSVLAAEVLAEVPRQVEEFDSKPFVERQNSVCCLYL
jgi:hypothetical protein